MYSQKSEFLWYIRIANILKGIYFDAFFYLSQSLGTIIRKYATKELWPIRPIIIMFLNLMQAGNRIMSIRRIIPHLFYGWKIMQSSMEVYFFTQGQKHFPHTHTFYYIPCPFFRQTIVFLVLCELQRLWKSWWQKKTFTKQ